MVARATLFITIILGLAHSAVAQSDLRLEVGAKLPKRFVTKELGLLVTASSQARPYLEAVKDNVKFLIAYDEKSLKICYLYTNDEKFETVAGQKVGDEITFTVDDLVILPYFEIRAPAGKDGWYPVIAYDDEFGGGPFIRK